MGNCQAAEAATVLIQHPGGTKVDRIYWSVSASEVMNSNPGHYVAMVIATTERNGKQVRQLKLLRPDDTLLLGHVYRLICFEDVLKEFAAKKCVKLGKLLRERGAFNLEPKNNQDGKSSSSTSRHGGSTDQMEQHELHHRLGNSSSSSSSRGVGRHSGGGGQWKPALHSIAELGT